MRRGRATKNPSSVANSGLTQSVVKGAEYKRSIDSNPFGNTYTNLPFRRWGEFMASPEQAVAIADRLIDNATILRFGGPPFRKPRDIHGAPLDGE